MKNSVQKKIVEKIIKEESEDNYRKLIYCPYCQGKLVKRGKRKKKYETIQLYYCKNCKKKITPLITKNKTYPLRIIMDSLTLYNRLNTLRDVADKITEKYGITITPSIILKWLKNIKNIYLL